MLLPSDWFYVYPVPYSVSFGFRVFLSFELVSWSCWAWLTESVSACVLQINIDKPLCRFHSKCRNQWLFLFKFYSETNLSVYGLQALNNSTVLSLRAWLGNNSAIQKTLLFSSQTQTLILIQKVNEQHAATHIHALNCFPPSSMGTSFNFARLSRGSSSSPCRSLSSSAL